MVNKKDKFNFAKSYSELQKIVEWFESTDDMDLEEGIEKFESGSELVKQLQDYLQTVEHKIKELKKDY